jgi:dihydroorotase (multifunctional complex type)
MIVDTTIRNCKLWFKKRLVSAGLAIDEGKIVKVSKDLNLPDSDKRIDCKGNIVLPGLVDVHVHFREPGLTWKEDWLTGSKAAAKGGITYVMDMPNTIPPTTTVERVLEKKKLARKSIVNFSLYAAIVNDNLDLIQDLSKEVKAFKVFMAHSTGGLKLDESSLLDAFSEVSKTDRVLCVHAEDQRVIDEFTKKYENRTDPLAFALSRPEESEISAINRAIRLADQTHVKLHICHVSTGKGTDLIRNAKLDGIDITCETCPHYLFMTLEGLKKKGTLVKMGPPLRTKKDQIALWKGILDGTIDILASDHAPHTLEEKEQDIWDAPSGVPGVETTLPLMLDMIDKRIVTLEKLVELMHNNPAKRFGLNNYGNIETENIANLTVIDLKKEWKISNENLLTKCGWSPFDEWRGKGVPVMTIVNGNVLQL